MIVNIIAGKEPLHKYIVIHMDELKTNDVQLNHLQFYFDNLEDEDFKRLRVTYRNGINISQKVVEIGFGTLDCLYKVPCPLKQDQSLMYKFDKSDDLIQFVSKSLPDMNLDSRTFICLISI